MRVYGTQGIINPVKSIGHCVLIRYSYCIHDHCIHIFKKTLIARDARSEMDVPTPRGIMGRLGGFSSLKLRL